jgi:hypothetical protein
MSNNANNNNKPPDACILDEDKLCDNCCDCFICDLDPNKLCDNCAKCLDTSDFNAVKISEIIITEENLKKK